MVAQVRRVVEDHPLRLPPVVPVAVSAARLDAVLLNHAQARRNHAKAHLKLDLAHLNLDLAHLKIVNKPPLHAQSDLREL